MDIEIQSDGKAGGIILCGSREIGCVTFTKKENTDLVFGQYSEGLPESESPWYCYSCADYEEEIEELKEEIEALKAAQGKRKKAKS